MEETKKPPRVWFSTREIAITAAFAGLEFVGVVMGLIIPVGPGGVSMWALQGLLTPAALAAGPIGGMLILIIAGTPRPVAAMNWVWSTQWFIVPFGYEPIKNKPLKIRIPLLFIWDAFLWFVWGNFVVVALSVYVYHFVPVEAFWSYWWVSEATFMLPSVILDYIFLLICFAAFPNFIKPDWWERWTGKK